MLPTDTLPLPTRHKGPSYVKLNATELRILQRLPAKFFFNFINESSFRLETNPFQTPTRSHVLQQLLSGQSATVPRFAKYTPQQQLSHVYDSQQVFREQPNVTAGWQFTPRTSTYVNYFMIRDSLLKSSSLNSVTQSLSGGVQYDIPIGKTFDLQPNLQVREMWQTGQPPLFDYLPAVTLSKSVGKSTTVYANTLLQMRGRQPFVAPHAELDPIYTVGMQTQKGRWQGSVSGTFLQNFRDIFGPQAVLPANSYGVICDFEVDRQVMPKYQGLQAFVRAEPVWNFHSHYTTGLSGFDFRLYYGLRLSLSKPALTASMSDIRNQIKQQIEQQERISQ